MRCLLIQGHRNPFVRVILEHKTPTKNWLTNNYKIIFKPEIKLYNTIMLTSCQTHKLLNLKALVLKQIPPFKNWYVFYSFFFLRLKYNSIISLFFLPKPPLCPWLSSFRFLASFPLFLHTHMLNR